METNNTLEGEKSLIVKRPAIQEDTEIARKIHHEAYKDVIIRQFGAWDEQKQDEYFNKEWNIETDEILLNDGVICGYCSIKHHPDHIFIDEMVISPEFQGQGIGTKLLKGVIQEAQTKGIPVRLRVFRENTAAHVLYERLGFKDKQVTDKGFEMELIPE